MKTVWVVHRSTIPGWTKAVDALREEYKQRLAGKIRGVTRCVLCTEAEIKVRSCYGWCPWNWFTGDGCGGEVPAQLRWSNNREWATRRIEELGKWKVKLEKMK